MALLKSFSSGASAPKVGLRRHLHRNLAGWRPDRPMKNVHASSVTTEDARRKFCPRAYALWDIQKPEKHQEFLSTALSMTFGIGRKVEDLVQDAMGLETLVGDWECAACSAMVTFQKQPPKCPKCNCKLMVYKEVRFVSQTCGASCGVDMLWDEGTGKLRVIESKSMDKDECKKLVGPLIEHKQRTAWYLRIIEDSDHPCKGQIHTDEAILLYTSKGGFGFADPEVKTWGFADDGFSPFKEFRVQRDDGMTEKFEARAQIVQEWRLLFSAWKQAEAPEHMRPPLPARVCGTSLDPRARTCSLCKACFVQGG